MIGIIVTGHANFATGITSSLNLIAGNPNGYYAVDFLEGQSAEDLSNNIENAINTLKEGGYENILIFTDLVGGSPFKTAVEIKMKREENIEVLSGTNLGMVIECTLTKDFAEDFNAFIEQALNTGKSQVIKYEYFERVEDDSEDGI